MLPEYIRIIQKMEKEIEKKRSKRERFSFRLDKGMLELLEKEAEKRGIHIRELVRVCIKKQLYP